MSGFLLFFFHKSYFMFCYQDKQSRLEQIKIKAKRDGAKCNGQRFLPTQNWVSDFYVNRFQNIFHLDQVASKCSNC